MPDAHHHKPVLLLESLSTLDIQEGEKIVDVTLGLGGHAEAFLAASSRCKLIGLDADEQNLCLAKKHLQSFQDQITYIRGNFSQLSQYSLGKFDVIFADLGLSSPHLDDPIRGFTFRNDAPLDMRYDRTCGETCAAMIARCSEQEIADILFRYGEVHQSRKIAPMISASKPTTTAALRTIVHDACGHRAHSILPQVFQALRIAVNDEMGALKTLLSIAPSYLKPSGRFAVIAYHSLEDRLVKQVFRSITSGEKDTVTGAISVEPEFDLLTKKAIKPSESEILANPRSRSARLRAIKRR